MKDEDVNLAEYAAVLRKAWWKIALVSVAAGLATLAAAFRFPNTYLATAVIAPAAEEGKQQPIFGGALSSLGIVVGGPTKVEDLESLFRSDDLTVRVFRKYDPWPTVFGDCYDARTGALKPGWAERIAGRGKAPKPPGDWDAIRAARKGLNISVNKRSGTLGITFESPSAEGSAQLVAHYLEEGKSRLQEEAFARATSNKKFIGEQIARTVDPLTRDRLYALYGQEVEREMLAKNREQFGFRVIDNPRVPDTKFRPRRATAALLATTASALFLCAVVLLRGRKSGGEA